MALASATDAVSGAVPASRTQPDACVAAEANCGVFWGKLLVAALLLLLRGHEQQVAI